MLDVPRGHGNAAKVGDAARAFERYARTDEATCRQPAAVRTMTRDAAFLSRLASTLDNLDCSGAADTVRGVAQRLADGYRWSGRRVAHRRRVP